MSGKRYTDEQRLWYFKNIVEVGIPPTGKKALEILENEWGKAPGKATLQYWVNPGEKDRLQKRTQKYRTENINIIVGTRLEAYRKHTKPISIEVPIAKNARTRDRGLNASFMWTIDIRITRFHAKGLKEVTKVPIEECTFLSKDVLNFWKHSQGYNPDTHDIRCHVCGDVLNMIHDTWHMDHIDPNGENTLENCSVAHSVCNQFKTTLRMEELIALSKKVINHHVSKNIS